MHRSFLSSIAPSVRARLWLLVAIVAVPAALLTVWLIYRSYRSERASMERHLLESALAYSSLVEAELRERLVVVQSLGTATALQSGDLAAFQLRAKVLVNRPGEWIVLLDDAGRVLIDTREAEPQEPHASAAWAPVVSSHEARETFVSDFIHTGEPPGDRVCVGMEVKIGGDRRGVLCLALTPEAVARAVLRNRMLTRGVVAIIDRNDVVIMRSRNPEKFVGQHVATNVQTAAKRFEEGLRDSRTLDGHASIAAFRKSRENGWLVVVAGYKSELFEPALQMVSIAAIVAVMVAFVVFGLALWVSRETEAVAQLIVQDTQTLARSGAVSARRTGVVEADAISRTLAETARELAARQAAIAQARDEAMAASRAKDDFLAALSHELRTPLNPVLLLASDGAHDPSHPPAVREMFATIEKNVMHESRLIDDLLDVTRIASGKIALQLAPMDIDAAIRDAIETLRPRALEKRLRLHIDLAAGEVRVVGDGTRLQQVFANVIGNAVKFTPDEGSVSVTSRVDRARGEAMIDISDNGLGLNAEELPRIFDRFTQGDHARQGYRSPYGGLGLGLAITKNLVEMHAGRIEAMSAGVGRGATFRIWLPVAVS